MGAQMAKGKCLFLLLFLFAVSTDAVYAQVLYSGASSNFLAWDKDHNARLTHAEFYNGLKQSGLFEHWDRKRDGAIDRQEFFSGKSQILKNTDQLLTAEAGLMAANTSGPSVLGYNAITPQRSNSSFPQFSLEEADLNRNGALDQAEFITALFRLWDSNVDGQINAIELRNGQLRRWFY